MTLWTTIIMFSLIWINIVTLYTVVVSKLRKLKYLEQYCVNFLQNHPNSRHFQFTVCYANKNFNLSQLSVITVFIFIMHICYSMITLDGTYYCSNSMITQDGTFHPCNSMTILYGTVYYLVLIINWSESSYSEISMVYNNGPGFPGWGKISAQHTTWSTFLQV